MKLDITIYRNYLVPIFTRKVEEFKDNDKFLKYLTLFCGTPGSPPAAAVYLIANELSPNKELEKRAESLIKFYGYEEVKK